MTRVSVGLGLAAAVLLLAGCAGIRDHRGYILDKQLVAGIQPGVDNKESVARTLGRPTFASEFDPNDWYYVSRNTRAFAFRNPRPVDQTVLRIRFDQAGNVAQVEQSGREKVASISPMDRTTPTLGRKRSFFEEMFGGIGMVGTGGMGAGGGGGGDE